MDTRGAPCSCHSTKSVYLSLISFVTAIFCLRRHGNRATLTVSVTLTLRLTMTGYARGLTAIDVSPTVTLTLTGTQKLASNFKKQFFVLLLTDDICLKFLRAQPWRAMSVPKRRGTGIVRQGSARRGVVGFKPTSFLDSNWSRDQISLPLRPLTGYVRQFDHQSSNKSFYLLISYNQCQNVDSCTIISHYNWHSQIPLFRGFWEEKFRPQKPRNREAAPMSTNGWNKVRISGNIPYRLKYGWLKFER